MAISDERLAELIASMDVEAEECESQRFSDVSAALRELQQSRLDAARYRKLRDADQSGAFIVTRLANSVIQLAGEVADRCLDRL